MLNLKKLPPRYDSEMHFKGVLQIGIESAIPLRHSQWHAAVHADDHISPWSRVNQWWIQDTYVLFLRTLSKIAYRQVEKRGPQNRLSMKPVNRFHAMVAYMRSFFI